MFNRKWGAVVGVLVLTLGLSGCAGGAKKEEAPKTVAQEPVLVKVQDATTGVFNDQIAISGNVAPAEEVVVSAKVGGDILSLGADLGSVVRKGQVLARIDGARYALSREKAGLDVSSAQLTLEDKRKDLERSKQLYAQNAISQKEYEAAVNTYKQMEIGLLQNQNSLKSADLNVRDTSITAPISGIVSRKNVNVGESVNAGSSLFSLVDISRVYLDTGVSEEVVNQITKGMTVQLTVPALAGGAVSGTVDTISPVQDSAKLYRIRVLIQNPEGKIKAGMFASGKITQQGGIQGIGVPKKAVLHSEGKDYLFVVSSGKALRKEVVVGVGNDDAYLIKKGLNVGEKVIVLGQEKLQDGYPVKVQ